MTNKQYNQKSEYLKKIQYNEREYSSECANSSNNNWNNVGVDDEQQMRHRSFMKPCVSYLSPYYREHIDIIHKYNSNIWYMKILKLRPTINKIINVKINKMSHHIFELKSININITFLNGNQIRIKNFENPSNYKMFLFCTDILEPVYNIDYKEYDMYFENEKINILPQFPTSTDSDLCCPKFKKDYLQKMSTILGDFIHKSNNLDLLEFTFIKK